ncbi:hypothetical protein [Mycolicibacterium monacense]|uniref:Uncharacterized protein n=1 Tax=Mycolicibacterium monacense TaxID=85693 RepID=A0AAD1IYP4_MYCMB|nr:hypothetical protein [Mycolicibacterium monacense]ORB24397.1 hypothetical protein BST34_00025 [Mycolicibacterium monacense DSM 44395]QHP83914.1 hypothetical protein EWR22_00255 [Mycolicibacterium monacense DSM 44395]BBZ63386.1 hypothetical protein MMON_46870 [Mycolicibacterium monacense]
MHVQSVLDQVDSSGPHRFGGDGIGQREVDGVDDVALAGAIGPDYDKRVAIQFRIQNRRMPRNSSCGRP